MEKEKVVAMVKAYYYRYASDPILKYVASELAFDLPVLDPDREALPYTRNAGKIDGIAELPDGKLAIVEHKTTGDDIEDDAPYWDTLLMDYQLSRYFLAAQELGYDVQTIIYDVTRKPQIRPRQILKTERQRATFNKNYFGIKLDDMCPDHETPKMYGARLYDDMTKNRGSFYFQRREITRLVADIAAYRKEQFATARQIFAAAELSEDLGIHAYPRNTKSCTMFGQCEYFQICRGLLGNPEEAVPAGFRISEHLHEELQK